MMCTYCGKKFSKEELMPLKDDDNPKLKRVYCPRCLPEVEDNVKSLPWVKNNRMERIKSYVYRKNGNSG